MWKRFLYLGLLLIYSSASNSAKNHSSKAQMLEPFKTRLLLRIEERLISEDRIVEYRFFDNGYLNKTVTYDSKKELYESDFKLLSAEDLKCIKELIPKLKELDYINHFPWKEDFYKKNNILKIEFIDDFEPIAIQANAKKLSVQAPNTYYYYTGLESEPKLFREIYTLLKDI